MRPERWPTRRLFQTFQTSRRPRVAVRLCRGPTKAPQQHRADRLPPAIPRRCTTTLVRPGAFPSERRRPDRRTGLRFDPNLNSAGMAVDFDGRAIFGSDPNKLFAFQLTRSASTITAMARSRSMTFPEPMYFSSSGRCPLCDRMGTGFGATTTDSALTGSTSSTAPRHRRQGQRHRTNGPAPLASTSPAPGSTDPGGQPLTFSWAFG